MSILIRKGNPLKESDLVSMLRSLSFQTSPLKKRSLNGSDAAFCPRKATLHYFMKNSYTEPTTLTSKLYFSIGNAVHDMIYEALKMSDILIANELPLFVGPVHGYIDDIVISPNTGDLKIIDVKTCGQLPSKIKPGQEEQILLYALLTGVREASILYVSRTVAGYDGVAKIKEIPANMTYTNLSRVARILAESSVFYHHKVVPPRPNYRISYDNCGFCPFKDAGCWSNDREIELEDGVEYIPAPREHDVFLIEDVTNHILENRETYYNKLLETLKESPRTNRPVFEKWLASRA